MPQVSPVTDKPGTFAAALGTRAGVANCKEVKLELPELILPPTGESLSQNKADLEGNGAQSE